MSNAKPFPLLLNQAVQIQITGRSDYICGVISNFLTNSFVVRFPHYAQMPEGFVAGLPVTVRFADISGLRISDSEIVELCEPPRPCVVVKLPLSFDTIQKRRYFRVQVDFPCSIQVLDPSGAQIPTGKDDGARVLDISVGGARVSTSYPLAVADRLQLTFVPEIEASKTPEPVIQNAVANKPLAGCMPIRDVRVQPLVGTTCPVFDTPNIQVMAKVVRVVPPSAESPNSLQSGVAFEKLPHKIEEQLITFIFNIQRNKYHRS